MCSRFQLISSRRRIPPLCTARPIEIARPSRRVDQRRSARIEFRRCFARVEDPSKTGDVGVDLRIDRAGGKAQVSHPRTALKGRDFRDCVVKTFEAIDFLKPKGGTTTVSYSLRFTPVREGL